MPDVAVEEVPCPLCKKMQPAPATHQLQCMLCREYGFACCFAAQGSDDGVMCLRCETVYYFGQGARVPGEAANA